MKRFFVQKLSDEECNKPEKRTAMGERYEKSQGGKPASLLETSAATVLPATERTKAEPRVLRGRPQKWNVMLKG
ncbi:hypothetical protein ACH5RR_040258 [Cinchona calisaya]|uniref:Uncharacterized protein n=1 Tax=Cinchona calisaya TaxID=153742 RepID=A0ABD2XRL9_9GENT